MMDSDSLVDVVLHHASTERLCPDGAAAEDNLKPAASDGGSADVDVERERRGQCCWALLLVPSCSLLLTAALATLTAGALMAASCSVQAQYRVSCHDIREAIINSSTKDHLLPGSSFRVLSSDETHLTVRHKSPVNGAQYHVYFLLKAGADADQQSCTFLSMATSSIWFRPHDEGAGFCALQHLTTLGLKPTKMTTTTCNSRALGECRPSRTANASAEHYFESSFLLTTLNPWR